MLSFREYKILMANLAMTITKEETELLMEKVDLTKGGIAVVAYMNTGYVKEYATNPSIMFIDCKEMAGSYLERTVPDNTKAIIMSEGLPQYHYTWLVSFCKRKAIPFLIRKSNQAVYDTLKSFFPDSNGHKPSTEEVREDQVKGKLNRLIEFIDWSKSNSENARILIRKAQEFKIRTTEASLAQFVSIQRRKKSGVTAVPKSVRSKLDISVEMLDEAIKGLGDMRDYLIAVVEENRLLKAKLDKFKKAMEE